MQIQKVVDDCEYCKRQYMIRTSNDALIIRIDNGNKLYVEDSDNRYCYANVIIKYCPMCGRRLRNKKL